MTAIPAESELRPGDLVLVEFGPTRGTEQDGRRPALVVSVSEMHTETRRAIVCPITGNMAPWATKVFLPAGLGVSGAVLTDQVRAIDRKERVLRRLGTAPDIVLVEVRHQLGLLLGIPPAAIDTTTRNR